MDETLSYASQPALPAPRLLEQLQNGTCSIKGNTQADKYITVIEQYSVDCPNEPHLSLSTSKKDEATLQEQQIFQYAMYDQWQAEPYNNQSEYNDIATYIELEHAKTEKNEACSQRNDSKMVGNK